ncbi:MAG: non-ribosomal peptide synthetase [Capsulimonadaceae bacterium]|nr:non-ribosomal peptide synthetase [Capsulimonadaceae bacterium]
MNIPSESVSGSRGFSAGSGTAVGAPPQDLRIRDLFEQQARCTPDAVALRYDGIEITYAVLNGRANQLARHLRSLGAGPGACVALSLERSPELVASVIAILKAGAAYVPLDASYPPQRVARMLSVSCAQILVTNTVLARSLESLPDNVVLLDEHWPLIDVLSEADLEPAGSPGDPTYVIFTSGSTGTPKGVGMPDRALVNLIWWHLHSPDAPGGGMGQASRTLQFAPISFDVSFQEIFSTLSSGGTLVLLSEDLRRDPDALLRYVADERIERLFLPVVALHQLAEASDAGGPAPAALREVITAGETLSVTPPVVRFFERLPGCELHNHYGPSETHVVTTHRLAGAPSSWPPLPPIGRAIPGAFSLVLDDQCRPVPVGEEGELYLGGECLALGYAGRPDLTEERFVVVHGSRCYRTGDRVIDLGGGVLQYLGRADGQVKIHGYRIETGEVEQALLTHAAVSGAAVVAHVLDDDKILAAYIVRRGDADVRVDELQAHLRNTLPEYMIPALFVFLDALPMTPSGKVDRRSLEQRPVEIALAAGDAAPRDAETIEEQIARIWAGVLPVSRPDWDTSFFDAGGNSVLVAKVHRKLRSELDAEFPITILFQFPTINTLARAIQQIKADKRKVRAFSLEEGMRDPRAVLKELKAHRRLS